MNQHPLTPAGDMDDVSDHAMKLHTSDGGYRVDTHRVLSCSGPCDQGRRECPCPADCQQSEAEEAPHVSGAMAWPIYVVLAALAVAACWHVAVRFAP